MAIYYIIVIKSSNNAMLYKINTFAITVLYKINTFIKKQQLIVWLEINWRRKIKQFIDPVLHIFFLKTLLISYVWILFSHISYIFCGLDLFKARADLC